MVELNTDELRELLGAYALDAVDDDERAQVERFLSSDPHASNEVAQFRELAALMANTGGDAPVGVWDRIADVIHGDPTALAPRSRSARSPVLARIEDARRRRVPRGFRAAAVVAAAAAAAAIALGVKVGQQQHHIQTLNRALGRSPFQRAYDAARADPRARTASLSAVGAVPAARVVLLPDGSGYFTGDALAPLGPGRTYQLWALVGDPAAPTAISAGVLGPAPRLAVFRCDGKVLGFAVTEEQAPGVVKSANQPVAAGLLA